jgi:putative inorganic carbon (hco3(-)) transporter
VEIPFRIVVLIPFILLIVGISFMWPKYGVFFFILIMIIRPQDDRPNLANLHVPLLIMVTVLSGILLRGKDFRVRIRTEHILLGLFIGALSLSGIINSSRNMQESIEEFLVNGFAFLFLTVVLREREDFRMFLWVLLGSGLYFVYLAIRQPSFMQESIGSEVFQRLALYKVNHNFGTTNYLAFLMGICSIIGLSLFCNERSRIMKVFALASFGGFIYVLLLSRSRMASYGVGLSMLLFPALQGRKRLYVYFLAAGVAIAIISTQTGEFAARMATITRYSEDTSIVDRFEFWRRGWEIFRANPVFGVGVGGFEYIVGQTPHNSFIQVLAEGGIVNIILFALIFLQSIMASKKCLSMKRSDENARGIVIAVFLFNVALFMQSMSTGMAHREITFIIFGITHAVANHYCGRPDPCAA